MAIDVAELEAAYYQALNRIRALEGVSTQHLWEAEAKRLERLRRKAAKAYDDFQAALKHIKKVRKVKV